MARRRLLAILATTVVAGGLSAAPAFADPVDGLAATDAGTPPAVGAGTGDGTVDVELEVDVAPSDQDGSPQLEVDGGATIADQEVDLGSVTDPVEDAIDPDPAPAPAPSPSPSAAPGDTTSPEDTDDPTGPTATGDGLPEGGGVVASSANGGPSPVPPPDRPPVRGVAGSRDQARSDVPRDGGGTASPGRVPQPELAPPVDAAVESPRTVAPSPQPQAPAASATGTTPGPTDAGPLASLLRVVAAAMVLGTGVAWARASRRA